MLKRGAIFTLLMVVAGFTAIFGQDLVGAARDAVLPVRVVEPVTPDTAGHQLSISSLASGGNLILAAGLGAAALLLYQAGRQSHLLEEIRQIEAQICALVQQDQRKAAGLSVLPGGPAGWIAARVQDGFGIYPELNEASIYVLEGYPLVQAISNDGSLIVISPQSKKALLKRFGLLGPGRGVRSLLNRLTREREVREVVQQGKIYRHSLGPSGETFDIEARMLAETLDFNWGQPNSLTFYLLQNDRVR